MQFVVESMEILRNLQNELDVAYILCFAQYSRMFIEPISIQNEV